MNKNHLSSKIYHDVRNYVSGVSGVAKIILDGKTSHEIEKNEDLKLIQTILEQSDQISFLIEEFLDSNDGKNQNFTLTKIQKHNINEIIKSAILNNQYFADQNNVKIVTDFAKNLPDLECDKIRISQILMNSINNAIKYSFQNGEVKISSKLIDDKICIEVLDNGIGMNAKEVDMALSGNSESINKSSLEKPIKSYGIGLPIIKDLVKLHKGKLEIKSTKGIGTNLKLYFNVDFENSPQAENNSLQYS